MTPLDLPAYLTRIGHAGPREPTLDVLRALQLAHVQAIPFENLDPLLDRPVPVDLPAIEAKLVRSRRGGYCFEQNLLFHAALTALGFEAAPIGARVYIDQDLDGIPARTHLAVRVVLDGVAWLADVGFGGQSPTGPLRLDTESAQETPHEPYRIVAAPVQPDHERLCLEAFFAGQWKLLYRFGPDESPMIDIVVANHYVATHPRSVFRKGLMVARVAPDGHHTLANDRLGFHRLGGETSRRQLTDAQEWMRALRDIFGIELDDETGLAAVFQRLKSR